MSKDNDGRLSIVDLALLTKDKEWFEHLTDPSFLKTMDVLQEYCDGMEKLNRTYTKAFETNDEDKMALALTEMNKLREKFNFPKEDEDKIKDLQYKVRAKKIMPMLERYGVEDVVAVLPSEAIELWKNGNKVHVYITKEQSLVTLNDYEMIGEAGRKNAVKCLTYDNICFTEGVMSCD